MRLCKMSTLACEYDWMDNDELQLELNQYIVAFSIKQRMSKEEKLRWRVLTHLGMSRGIQFSDYVNLHKAERIDNADS
jgi:hypothetical protein